MTRTIIAFVLTLTAFTVPAGAACPTEGMSPDMHRAYVEGIQTALAEHGFKPGKADGKMGRNTQSAIRAYQRAAKLPVDGCATKELLDHLNFAQPKVYATGKGR